jgi:hypothetical protein
MGTGEPGADGIDVHNVRHVEDRVLVVNQPAGDTDRLALVIEFDALRSEETEMQPDRRRAGAAVECEGNGAVCGVGVVFGVGDIKEDRFLVVRPLDYLGCSGGGVRNLCFAKLSCVRLGDQLLLDLGQLDLIFVFRRSVVTGHLFITHWLRG